MENSSAAVSAVIGDVLKLCSLFVFFEIVVFTLVVVLVVGVFALTLTVVLAAVVGCFVLVVVVVNVVVLLFVVVESVNTENFS